MKACFGLLIVFGLGISTILGISSILDANGYTTVFITVVKLIGIAIIIAIPIFLIRSRNSDGDNKLEAIGSPIASILNFATGAYTSPTGRISLLLIIIINILLWK